MLITIDKCVFHDGAYDALAGFLLIDEFLPCRHPRCSFVNVISSFSLPTFIIVLASSPHCRQTCGVYTTSAAWIVEHWLTLAVHFDMTLRTVVVRVVGPIWWPTVQPIFAGKYATQRHSKGMLAIHTIYFHIQRVKLFGRISGTFLGKSVYSNLVRSFDIHSCPCFIDCGT